MATNGMTLSFIFNYDMEAIIPHYKSCLLCRKPVLTLTINSLLAQSEERWASNQKIAKP